MDDASRAMVDPKWSCADGRCKEISCCFPKDILIPLPRIPFSFLWRATGLLRPRSPDILPLLSFVRPIFPGPSWAGAVGTGVTFATFGSPWLCHWFPHTFSELLWCYGVTGCATEFSTSDSLHLGANSLVFTMWSGGASLHRVEEHLSGLWGRFVACSLYARPSHAVSPRPGLGKLLALSNFPAYVHFVIRVSQDITASVVLCFLILYVIGASFSLIECASCHRYLEPNGFSARILLLRAPSMTRIRNGSLVSDALFRGFLCFRICLINSFIVLANDCECFCCFSRTWNCPFRVVVADWRANRPGHVP